MTDAPHRSLRPSLADISDPEYAGFWLRFWAGVIDIAIECVVALLLSIALHAIFSRVGGVVGMSASDSKVFTGQAFIVILAVGAWLYVAFMESSSWRATLGKRLLGLEVVNADGGRLSFGQATVRHLMKFLSLFTAAIGFMMAAWTKRCQALHDIPLDCIVIKVPKRSFSLLG